MAEDTPFRRAVREAQKRREAQRASGWVEMPTLWEAHHYAPFDLSAGRWNSRCPHHHTALAAYVKANGTIEVRRVCRKCCRTIGYEKKARVEWVDLPVVADNRRDVCERCGALGVEEHHWAPRHLFHDADWWPTSLLCIKCHSRWHAVMTPNKGRVKPRGLGGDRRVSWDTPRAKTGCERCGGPQERMTPFAPYPLFRDSDQWRHGFLCVACDEEWNAIVAPGLDNPTTYDPADEFGEIARHLW